MQNKDIQKLKDMRFNLMPLQKESKKPIAGVNWTEYQTKMYTGTFPDSCNIAVICGETSGGLFVVDLDDESLYKDFNYNTFTVKTGKGYHLYFRASAFLPDNRKLDDYRFRHVDIKSQGGYILGAGSIHPDTKKPYEIVKDVPVLVINPQDIMSKLKDIGFKTEKLKIEDIEKGVSSGGRNDATFKYACSLVRDGIYGEPLKIKLEELNSRHKPPLPQYELDTIWEQAMKYEVSKVKPSEEMVTIDNLREKARGITKENVNLSVDFAEYTKVLGSHVVEKIIKQENKNVKINIAKPVKLHDINPNEHEGILVEFECMITALGQRMTYNMEAEFICPQCGDKTVRKCNDYHEIPIPYCTKDKCKYGIDLDSRKTAFIQQMKIEEFLEDTLHNSPIEYDCEIHDENVGTAFMGDRMRLVGKFRSIPPKSSTQQYNVIVFDILQMEHLEQQSGCMPEPSEIEKWKSTEDMFGKVRDSIVPDVLIDNNIIESIILFMAGGNSLNSKRNPIHTLLCGDAQLGKSELLRRVHKIIPGSGFTEGRKTTAAGLTIGMVKMYDGTMVPKAGLLPKHTGFPVIIDEVDKLKQEDQDSILECMEQLKCTLSKAGFAGLSWPTICELLVAGNPKGGKFVTKGTKSVMDNFNMSEPFMSRFDIIWLMIDANDPDVDAKIRNHIRYFRDNEEKYMRLDELQRYFTYVRSLDATVPDELMDKIDELHIAIRPLNQGDNGIPIGWRQYHGLYRLITASATAHLRTVATEEDFEVVDRIIRKSYESFKLNVDTGKAEANIKKTGKKKSDLFEAIWRDLQDDNEEIYRDDIIKELRKSGRFSSLEANVEFNKRHTMGEITLNNRTDKWKWT